MANPLFNQFGNKTGSESQFLNDFRQIQQTVKNPRQVVENLLQSGQMSQAQFAQLSQMANAILGRK